MLLNLYVLVCPWFITDSQWTVRVLVTYLFCVPVHSAFRNIAFYTHIFTLTQEFQKVTCWYCRFLTFLLFCDSIIQLHVFQRKVSASVKCQLGRKRFLFFKKSGLCPFYWFSLKSFLHELWSVFIYSVAQLFSFEKQIT